MAVDATDKIAVLNDALRANLPEPDLTFYVAGKGALTVPVNGGFLALTPLVQQVGVKNPSVLKTIFTKVREFSEFSEEIDPNGNREFGLIAYYDEEFF